MALSPSDKRALIILGAVAGIAIVVFLGMKLLGGGGGDEAASPVADGTSPGATTSDVSPAPSTGDGTTGVSPAPPGTDSFVISGKDPFSPLPLVTPSVSVSPVPGESPSTGTCEQTATIDGNEVTLNKVIDKADADIVKVTVNDSPYSAAQGDTFARYYTAVVVDPTAAQAEFNYSKGSVNESFTLCI
ncbi:MAG: hypothetical protein WD004_07400 [Actinomycetota bacterium]